MYGVLHNHRINSVNLIKYIEFLDLWEILGWSCDVDGLWGGL